MHRIHTN